MHWFTRNEVQHSITYHVVSIQAVCKLQKHLCCPMNSHTQSSTFHWYTSAHFPDLRWLHTCSPHELTHADMDLVIHLLHLKGVEDNWRWINRHKGICVDSLLVSRHITFTWASNSCIFRVATSIIIIWVWRPVSTAQQSSLSSSAPNICHIYTSTSSTKVSIGVRPCT